MAQSLLKKHQSLEADLVERARGYLDSLVKAESRRFGDTDNAIRRIAQATGLTYWPLWSLHYRPSKKISAGTFIVLSNAYEAMCEQQRQRLSDQLSQTCRRGPVSKALARFGDSIAG